MTYQPSYPHPIQWYTVTEAAAYLGVSRRTVGRRVAEGRLFRHADTGLIPRNELDLLKFDALWEQGRVYAVYRQLCGLSGPFATALGNMYMPVYLFGLFFWRCQSYPLRFALGELRDELRSFF